MKHETIAAILERAEKEISEALNSRVYLYIRVERFGVSLSPNQILNNVSVVTGIPVADIVSKHRSRAIMDARTIAAFLIYSTGLTLKQTAELIGCVNHTTVRHLVKKCKSMKGDETFSKHLETLKAAM